MAASITSIPLGGDLGRRGEAYGDGLGAASQKSVIQFHHCPILAPYKMGEVRFSCPLGERQLNSLISTSESEAAVDSTSSSNGSQPKENELRASGVGRKPGLRNAPLMPARGPERVRERKKIPSAHSPRFSNRRNGMAGVGCASSFPQKRGEP